MKEEKILMTFRTTKDRKRGLEYLASQRGVSVTQYLNLLISDTLLNFLNHQGTSDAIEQAAIMVGIEKHIAKNFKHLGGLEDLKKIMDKEKYGQLLDAFSSLHEKCIQRRWKEYGIDAPETESEKILKETN